MTSTKGKTYEEIYGEEKAAELRKQRSQTFLNQPSPHKGKTYEEIYGPEKAAEMRRIRSSANPFRNVHKKTKGKTYEEIYGEEKAKELRQNRKESRTGERNNWWRGGVTVEGSGYRGEDWEEVRTLALIRDSYTCQDCGIPKRKLDVHHKIPWHVTHDNSLDNLISLCSSCHKLADLEYIRNNGHYPIMGVVISLEEKKQKEHESKLKAWQNPERRRKASERLKNNKFSPKNLPRDERGKFIVAQS